MKKYSLLLLLIALFSFGARAAQTPVTLTSDGNGGWFINMPARGTATTVEDAAVLTLTADDLAAGKYTFKVYDDGGQFGYYPDNYTGYLIITAPTGYRMQIGGSVVTESCCDYLTIYDGTTTNTYLGEQQYKGITTVNNVRSTASSVMLYFRSDGSQVYPGLDLTAITFKENSLVRINGINGAYDYPASAFSYTVTDIDDNVIDPANYTASLTLNGNPVNTVSAIGDYTLTVVGNASYPGTVSKSFVVTSALSGSGTEVNPYLINNAADWDIFATKVRNGFTFNGKFVRLESSITITTMAGISEDCSFQGTFLGNNKTLTLDLTATEDFCAPFRYVKNATISNLNVAGTVSTDFKRSASIAAIVYGTTNLNNCVSTATITYTSSSWQACRHGGLVSYAMSGTTLTLTDCIFAGKLLGNNAYGNGGLVGCVMREGTVHLYHSLFAPTERTMNTSSSYTFVNTNDGGTCTSHGSFYTEQYNSSQSTTYQVYVEQPTEFNKKEFTVGATNYYSKEVPSINVSSFFNYTGSPISVEFDVTYLDTPLTEGVGNDYTYEISPATVQAVGTYTLTITGHGNYANTHSVNFAVVSSLAGQGTQASPYLIANADDWGIFVDNVNNGQTYYGKYVRLENDITVTTMAGSTDASCFRGVFDGNIHTLTVNIISTATGTSISDCGVAPFRYINNATIKNLTVAGTITSASNYAGGLVGWATNYSQINDVVVTATITTSADYAGGLVGNIYPGTSSSIYFENCVFAGAINSTSTNSERHAGGFIGYGSGYSSFTNCLENGTYTNLTMMNPRNAHNYYDNYSVNSLYYVNKIGDVGQYITDNYGCHQVTTVVPEALYLARTIHGYNFYQPTVINGLNETYPYNNGDPVVLGYTLKMNNTTLVEDTDYEVAYLPAAPAAVGNYTVTFSAKAGNAAGYVGSTTRSFRIMVGESLDGYVFATEGEGGSKVYLINDESDLERLAAYVNSGHTASGKTFKLNADITMTANHTPIGGYFNGNYCDFYGTFDGNSRTITNLTINNASENYQGLFGRASNSAVIKDLTLANCNITGKDYTGGITGYAYSLTIQNCHVSGAITGVDNVGGIIGYASSSVTVTSCENAASISGTGTKHGGIVGEDKNYNNSFNLCLNTGILEGTSYVGGIAGKYYYTSNFTNCYYAPPCNYKAFGNETLSNSWDSYGNGQRAYAVTAGAHVTNITVAESGVATSTFTGNQYFKNGNWTLTLTLDLTGVSFVKYNCEGGTLTNLTIADGDHVLTVNSQDVTISAIVSNNSGTDIAGATIAAIPDQQWKGSVEVTPALNVTFNSTPLVEGTDFIVTWTDNTVIGEATVTLAGINNYKGTKSTTFNIIDFPLLNPGEANSADNPWLIATEADLQALSCIVNTGARNNGYYRQSANITLTEEHTAIGNNNNSNYRFKGTYDGDNKTISGLTINKTGDQDADRYQGLFGYTYYATIKNVSLVGCNITGYNKTGGVVGYANYGSVSNCTVSGTIQKAEGKSPEYLGGIAGCADNCYVTQNTNHATVNGAFRTGGIAGYFYSSTLSNNFNTGTVTGTSYVGSIIGYKSSSGTVTNNYYPAGLGLTGGIGEYNVATGTDQIGAEVAFTITAGANTQATLPTTPAYVWNTTNLYKNGTEVTLSYEVPAGKFFDKYTVNSGEITRPYNIDGTHALTGVADNVTITGTHSDKMDIASNAVTVQIGIIPYTGSVITVTPLVTRLGVTLVQGTDYTFVTSPATVQDLGDYTMTLTGMGNYTGTRNANFTVAEPTLIHNATDWNTFATNINAGTGCDGYYKLADDFDNSVAVTTTVGTTAHPFAGLFEGNGKTLNVNINETSTQGTAPFREIAGATIQNLTVSGSVTGTYYASGLVGFTRSGINTIDNCVVNTNVSTTTSNRYIGGIVGHGVQATLNISNTAYTGTFSNYWNYAGGLLGWSDGSTLNITNCLVTGGKTSDNFHPIAIKNNTAVMNVTVNGAFYTKDPTLTDANYIAATGIKVYSGVQSEFCKKEYTLNATEYYSKEETVIGNVDNVIEYTGSAITVTPTVTYNGAALTETTDYNVTIDPATVQEVGAYTITITGTGNYAGTQSLNFNVVTGILAGSGTEVDPYIIASTSDWNKFAGNINTGAYNYNGCFVKLTEDITITTMAGNSEANSFQGTFLGTAGKTLTLDLTATANDCAPFTYLKNATIQDLNIAGTITTGYQYGASIAAHTYGNTYIRNCVSTVVITSTYTTKTVGYHAGFVSMNENSAKLYFYNCIFAGKLLGDKATSNGGFVGYTRYNVYYTDCLFAPTEITMSSSNSCTFNCNSYNSFTRAYYLTAFGSTQGTHAYASANVPATPLFGQITATDGNTYYVEGSVSGISNSYAYTGNAIVINPTFSIQHESVTFVKDTDYEVAITYTSNPVTEVNAIGDYVFTFTGKDGGLCKGTYTKNVNVYAEAPDNFRWATVTASTATVTWTDDHAANWTVEISTSSDFSTIMESRDVTEKTATFTGLTAETNYYTRVKAVYGEISSNWSTTCLLEPSDKIIIGSGIDMVSYLPTAICYNYALTEQIYTASEIGQSGTILSIDFHCDSERTRNNITIYMMNTEKTSFESNTDWVTTNTAGVVQVFSGTVVFNANCWTTITLNTPFAYDNTKNLLVILDDNQGDYNCSPSFRVFSTTGNEAMTQYSDYNNNDPANPTYEGSRYTKKNQIRLRMSDKIFTIAGNWNVASNWTPAGAPTATDHVAIMANATIPANCSAEVNTINVASGNTLTIADGGQLKHNNTGVTATMEKGITGYGSGDGNYYLMASPMASNLTVSTGTNLAEGDFDLYYFDQSQKDIVWRNYEASTFTLNNGKGYLYANSADKTATLTGQLKPSNLPVEVSLAYSTGKTWTGWNLIGNPFACNAYLTNGMAFYKMNAAGTGLEAADANTAISPLEGVFVKATGSSQKATFTREAPVTSTGNSNLNIYVAQVINSRDAIPATDNAIIRFGEGSTLEKFCFREGSTKVYIPQDGKDYALVNAEDKGEMPINFKAEENGTYTFYFNSLNTEFSYLHLIDNLTGNDVDLLAEPSYTFDARYTDYESRFKLVFATNGSNTGDNFGFIDAQGNLMILGLEGQATLQLVDVTGRILSTESFYGSYSKAINQAAGVYMLRLIQGKNVKTQKIVVR